MKFDFIGCGSLNWDMFFEVEILIKGGEEHGRIKKEPKPQE
jgi:hypothetical protein